MELLRSRACPHASDRRGKEESPAELNDSDQRDVVILQSVSDSGEPLIISYLTFFKH